MNQGSRSSGSSESERGESSHSESDSKSTSSSRSASSQRKINSSRLLSPNSDGKRKRTSVDEIKQCWEENPDVYGIRRSGRSRKEPERLAVVPADSDSEPQKARVRIKQKKRHARSDSSDSDGSSGSGSESSFEMSAKGKRAARTPVKSKKKSSGKSKKSSKPLPRVARRVNLSESSDESSSSSEPVARSRTKARRAAAKVNYREVSDDDEEGNSKKKGKKPAEEVDHRPGLNPPGPEDGGECVEKIMDRRIGRPAATGACTTMYSVAKMGDPNRGFDPKSGSPGEEQYLIKWQGWSHLHCTWESLRSLQEQGVRGLKKVENYLKKEDEIAVWKARANPEDVEYFECQREMMQDLAETYTNVERVIAAYEKPQAEQPDYLVKWENLPYSESTWEDGNLIQTRWASKIDEFLLREQSTSIAGAKKHWTNRPKFVTIKEQPDYLGANNGLKLRDYQLTGLNWLVNSWCRNNSVILADEMGLGKTIQVICFLSYLFKNCQIYGPFLLVVPLSTMTAWQREFSHWFPEMNVIVYVGDVNSRNTIRKVEWNFPESGKLKFNALLTTYEILLKDKTCLSELHWAVLVVDEAHRLKNEDSLLYRSLTEFKTHFRVLVTGTPLQNSLRELWALLHFIMEEAFETWEEFDREHTAEKAKKIGYKGLHKQLEPYILRRVKKDVERSLPAKVEQILRVDMTSQQKTYYKWILTKNFEQLRKGNRGSVTTFANIVVELKKCCNHSFLTKPPEDPGFLSTPERIQRIIRGSGKLLLLDKLLVRLRETGHRVLIFSQMVRMLDILSEYLMLRHFPFQRLDGGIKGDMRRQALDHFNAEGSQDFCFLLSTRAGGLGINLATADTVIIFDSDWNPQNDLQAQSRAHRIGQKNQVNIYRLVTRASVEETIIERAKKKMILDHLVIQNMDTTGRAVLDQKPSTNASVPFNKEELTAILKFGAEELFKDDEEHDDEPACDIDEILRRAETRDDEPKLAGDELLSQFKVTSFVFDEDEEKALQSEKKEEDDEETKDWGDIIPDKFRKKVEEKEKEKDMADLYLPPRSRKSKQSTGKKEDEEESEEDDDEDDDDEDDSEEETGKKKRGRKAKEPVKGFTTPEIRRFLKSWRKFPNPMARLDSIAVDAELEEKSNADLKRLGETIIAKCREAVEQQPSGVVEDGKRSRGPKIKIGGVPFNARTLLTQMDDLKPLESLPSDKNERSRWVLDVKVKAVHWDCDWTPEDDSRLLQGIYEYGMGSWESIKLDPALKLEKKILPEDGKPNEKQLHTRAEYLIRHLSKNSPMFALKEDKFSPKKGRKPKTKAFVEDDSSSDEDKPPPSLINNDHVRHKTGPKPSLTATVVKAEREDDHDEKKKKEHKEHKEHKKHHHHHHHHKKNKKKPEQQNSGPGPMHFTTHETVAINVTGELSAETFKECKEKMRPVKKSLKQLGKPDHALSEKDQLSQTRLCLRLIGDHINSCLMAFHDPEKIREWRSNLWFFVSKFTEFDAPKLYKLYKKAKQKDEDGTLKKSKKSPGSNKISPNTKRKVPEDSKAGERSSSGATPAKRQCPSTSSSNSNFWNKRKRDEEAPKNHGYKIPPKEQTRRSESPPEVDHVLPPIAVAALNAAEAVSAETNSTPSKSNSNSAAASSAPLSSTASNDADLEEGEMRDDDVGSAVDYQPLRRPVVEDRDDRWRDYNHRYQRHSEDVRRERGAYQDAYYRPPKVRPSAWSVNYPQAPLLPHTHTAYYPHAAGPSNFRSFPRDRRDPRVWDREKKLGPP